MSPRHRHLPTATALLASLSLGMGLSAQAAGVPTLDTVEVKADERNLLGVAETASEGSVSAAQLAHRPLLRPAEALEVVPGLIVTQHAGDGKANQYFLRGFNLDHGTDFSASLLGMPLNLPSHAHGQGYLDLNFLIPELISRMDYRKGPYAADQGDFSSAGSVRIDYLTRLPAETTPGEASPADHLLKAEVGSGNARRLLLVGSPVNSTDSSTDNSPNGADGQWLYALENVSNDGPWQNPENLQRLNGVLRYHWGTASDGGSLSLLAYQARWNSTDQVPAAAIDSGLIDRYGSIDPSDGGNTHRYSLSGQWQHRLADGRWQASAYMVDYALDLWSNFTYYTNPSRGDQFEQVDRRHIYGGKLERQWLSDWNGREVENTLGLEARLDRIDQLGLYLTTQRQRWATVREDGVSQNAWGAYAQNSIQWLPWLRSRLGLRGDWQQVRVNSDLPQNSGTGSAQKWSPKLGLVLGPWRETEFYWNHGLGFHSNDARGALTHLNPDPRDSAYLQAVSPVTPLVRTRGSELGLRSAWVPGLQLSASLWRLALASELLFTGDAGTTEPSRPSLRQGVELAAFWRLNEKLSLDADLAFSRARYTEHDPVGDFVPGAVERVASVSLDWAASPRWHWGMRLRHFGPRALTEDNTQRSAGATVVNLLGEIKLDAQTHLGFTVLNLFNRQVSDIDYFYASAYPKGATTSDGIHTHPAEPRSLRLSLSYRW